MPVKVKDRNEDGMKEATVRLDISRNTLLSYIKEGIVTSPPTVKRGKTHYRYFPAEWYSENEQKVRSLGT